VNGGFQADPSEHTRHREHQADGPAHAPENLRRGPRRGRLRDGAGGGRPRAGGGRLRRERRGDDGRRAPDRRRPPADRGDRHGRRRRPRRRAARLPRLRRLRPGPRDGRRGGEGLPPPTTGTTGDGATGDGAGATGTTPTTTAGTTTTGATPRCAVRYLRIKRPKGKAALYRRRQTCPKAKTKSKAKAKASAAPAKPAIVLDIDETSLSNYDGLVATGFSSAGTAIPAAAGTGTAIAPILALYRDARAKGVAVFFVTGRPSAIAQVTAENLRSAGYTAGWDGLQFKPTDQTTVAFKAGARAAVEQRGYDIVLDAGDQESDLDGGHADRLFKLPNPYYFIAD
jgi:hypothetical protein